MNIGLVDDGVSASSNGASEFEDSFLREMAWSEPLVPMPMLGDWLGGVDGRRYEILALIGDGGMGRVFRALDHGLQRTVALKFLRVRPGHHSPGYVEFLRAEAQAVARLDHENIVRIHDVSEWSTSFRMGRRIVPLRIPFLVMEYLDGETLHALLKRLKRLELTRALEIMIDVAAGLAHAHERHLIHCDLKPGNVFILTRGRAKLLDFGLAQLKAGAAAAGGGTPAYMAPEQWRGESLQASTDLWAAGLILHEMLTGRPPFAAESYGALLAQVTSDEPVHLPRWRDPQWPEEVPRLLASLLAKKPEERLHSGTELLKALCELQERLALQPGSTRDGITGWTQIAVVCCRLELATGTEEQLDPEDCGELEATFQLVCSNVLRQHGGVITTCIGAEVLACFGHPMKREDDSERAVRAALELQRTLSRELANLQLQGSAVKVGVHTGLVLLTEATPELRGASPAMQGETPGVAIWLATQARPGSVWVSGQTHALIRGGFQTNPQGERTFGGPLGTSRVCLYEVLQERRSVSRFDRALVAGDLTPLVGRERELRQLTHAWNEALHGPPGALLLLRGEAGIGKSRLIQELHDQEPSGASTWARCQCWPQFQSSAFHPLLEWLQRFLEFAPDDSPQRKQQRLRERLEAHGLPPEHEPPLAALLSLPIPEDSPFLQFAPERQRNRSLDSLVLFLQRTAAQRPLVLVVEDLHWADPSTLLLLERLLGQLGSTHLCMLLTARPEFESPWDAGPLTHTLELKRLPPEATAAMVRHLVEGTALPSGTVGRLVAMTDGIPLFIEEMTRMLLDRKATSGAALGKISGIPVTLRELLLARLNQLPARSRALVQLAATLGREFSHELLRATSPQREEALLEELEQLERARLLFRQGEPPGVTYSFKHALIQDAAYQSLPRSMRQRYHARIFQVLSEQFPQVAAEQPELLAQHASRAGLLEQAVEHWQLAGRRASARSALSEALDHYTKALEQLLLLPASRERDQQESTLRIELGMALGSAKGYSVKEVEDNYLRARALSEKYGDVPLIVLWGIWAFELVRGNREGTERMGTYFRRIAETSDDTMTLVIAHAALCAQTYWQGQLDECLRHGDRVRALTREHRLAEQLSAIRGSLGHIQEMMLVAHAYPAYCELRMGRVARERERYSEVAGFTEATRHPYAAVTVLQFGATLSALEEEPEDAFDRSARLISICAENGFPFQLAVGKCIHGWATARLGDAQAGIQKLREGLAMFQAMGSTVVCCEFLALLADAYLVSGQLEDGLATVETGLEIARTDLSCVNVPSLKRLQGELLLRRGEEEAARACFQESMAVARGFGSLLDELHAAVSQARLLRRRDEEHEAYALLREVHDRLPEECELKDCQAARQMLASLAPTAENVSH